MPAFDHPSAMRASTRVHARRSCAGRGQVCRVTGAAQRPSPAGRRAIIHPAALHRGRAAESRTGGPRHRGVRQLFTGTMSRRADGRYAVLGAGRSSSTLLAGRPSLCRNPPRVGPGDLNGAVRRPAERRAGASCIIGLASRCPWVDHLPSRSWIARSTASGRRRWMVTCPASSMGRISPPGTEFAHAV